MRNFTEDELISELRELTERETQRAVALRFGMSPQFINDVLNHRRPMTDKLAQALGFRRAPAVYVAMESEARPGGKTK